MKNCQFRYTAIIAALLMVGITSCEKQNTFPSGTYLIKVIYHQNVSQIRHYNYNGKGQLSEREYEFDGRTIERFEYQYQNGLISRINFFGMKNYNDLTLYLLDYVQYEYISDNIVRSIKYPGNLSVNYTYNADNQIIKSAVSSADYTMYDYDNNGNISKATVYKDGIVYWSFYYSYDSKINPFYNIEPIHESFTIMDLIRYKCPNNLVRKTFINENQDTISDSEYKFKYNPINLPAQSYELFTSESNGYHRDSMNLLLYVYESR